MCDSFNGSDIIVSVECGHLFHEVWVGVWRRLNKNNCPECRTIITAHPSRMFLNIRYDVEIANLRAQNENLASLKTAATEMVHACDTAIRKQQADYEQLKMVNITLEKELHTSMWDNEVKRKTIFKNGLYCLNKNCIN